MAPVKSISSVADALDAPRTVSALTAPEQYAIAGVRLASACAGFSAANRPDLALIELATGSSTSLLTTRNTMVAAPVQVARAHWQQQGAQALEQPGYWLVNALNANSATGAKGLQNARLCCSQLADLAQVAAESVLPFSTGVIGTPLDMPKLLPQLPVLFDGLSDSGWLACARAIMTTDTEPKLSSKYLEIGGQPIRLTGVAKGVAMLNPNMATTLCFTATDAGVEPSVLHRMHQRVLDGTINRISIDGDTSTNDCSALAATGRGAQLRRASELQALEEVLTELYAELAEAMIRDAEGAQHVIEVRVEGGASTEVCRLVADTVANSVLLKACLSASEPNWGRVLMAIGNSTSRVDFDQVSVWLGDVLAFDRGQPAATYTEEAGFSALDVPRQLIRIDLGQGTATDYALTSDLTQEYVRLNSEYRT